MIILDHILVLLGTDYQCKQALDYINQQQLRYNHEKNITESDLLEFYNLSPTKEEMEDLGQVEMEIRMPEGETASSNNNTYKGYEVIESHINFAPSDETECYNYEKCFDALLYTQYTSHIVEPAPMPLYSDEDYKSTVNIEKLRTCNNNIIMFSSKNDYDIKAVEALANKFNLGYVYSIGSLNINVIESYLKQDGKLLYNKQYFDIED